MNQGHRRCTRRRRNTRVQAIVEITGRGVAIVDVDSHTGLVKAAQINPSTEDKDLDQPALKAFRQWRFGPGEASRVNIPIRFTFSGTAVPSVKNDSPDVLYAPDPVYPVEAWSRHLTGIGTVFVHVDQKTGNVTAARMLQRTGYRILDEAALATFRQWRLRPGTVSHVRIPIKFLMRGMVPVVYE